MSLKGYPGFLAAALMLMTTPAYAYLDPGTGSMILQVIIGAIAAALLSIKLAWHRLKHGVASLFRRDQKQHAAAKEQEQRLEL